MQRERRDQANFNGENITMITSSLFCMGCCQSIIVFLKILHIVMMTFRDSSVSVSHCYFSLYMVHYNCSYILALIGCLIYHTHVLCVLYLAWVAILCAKYNLLLQCASTCSMPTGTTYTTDKKIIFFNTVFIKLV